MVYVSYADLFVALRLFAIVVSKFRKEVIHKCFYICFAGKALHHVNRDIIGIQCTGAKICKANSNQKTF